MILRLSWRHHVTHKHDQDDQVERNSYWRCGSDFLLPALWDAAPLEYCEGRTAGERLRTLRTSLPAPRFSGVLTSLGVRRLCQLGGLNSNQAAVPKSKASTLAAAASCI